MTGKFDPLRLADVAAGQWGLITTAQAERIDATAQRVARMANAGTLERLRHGIYRLTGTPAHPYDDIRASWLALDPSRTAAERLDDEQPGGVISHRSAALMHGLGDLDADRTDITVPGRRRSRAPDIRFHTGTLTADQRTIVDGLPVTTVAVTVGQMAAAHTDGGHLAGVVRDALTAARVPPGELAAALRPYAHRYGAPLGDGDGVIQLFLDQVGVPASTLVAAAARSVEISRMVTSLGLDPATLAALSRGQGIGPVRELMDRIRMKVPVIDPSVLAVDQYREFRQAVQAGLGQQVVQSDRGQIDGGSAESSERQE